MSKISKSEYLEKFKISSDDIKFLEEYSSFHRAFGKSESEIDEWLKSEEVTFLLTSLDFDYSDPLFNTLSNWYSETFNSEDFEKLIRYLDKSQEDLRFEKALRKNNFKTGVISAFELFLKVFNKASCMKKEKILLKLKEKAKKLIVGVGHLKKDINFCISLISIARLQPFYFLESCSSKVRKLIYLKIQRKFLEELELYKSELELKIEKISLKMKSQEKFERIKLSKRVNFKSDEDTFRKKKLSFKQKSSLFRDFKNIKDFESMKTVLADSFRNIEEKLYKNQGGLENERLQNLEGKISKGFNFS